MQTESEVINTRYHQQELESQVIYPIKGESYN